MFRTSIKIIGTVLAAAAVAVPVASASPKSSEAQVFSLGTALVEYQQKSEATTPGVGQGFSLGIPLEYQQRNEARTPRVGEGFSLGVPLEYQAQSTLDYLAPIAAGPGALELLRQAAQRADDAARRGRLQPRRPARVPGARGRHVRLGGLRLVVRREGAGVVAGVMLLIAGIGAMTIRARHGRGRISAAY